MNEKVTSYFRYDEVCIGTGYTDEYAGYISTGSYVKLRLQEFKVIKHTPRGVRIDDYKGGHGRFISHDWNKQWACPTVEEARLSFIARKKRQAKILEKRLQQTREALLLAESKDCPDRVGWLIPLPKWARGSS